MRKGKKKVCVRIWRFKEMNLVEVTAQSLGARSADGFHLLASVQSYSAVKTCLGHDRSSTLPPLREIHLWKLTPVCPECVLGFRRCGGGHCFMLQSWKGRADSLLPGESYGAQGLLQMKHNPCLLCSSQTCLQRQLCTGPGQRTRTGSWRKGSERRAHLVLHWTQLRLRQDGWVTSSAPIYSPVSPSETWSSLRS